MGLLSEGEPLDWEEMKKWQEHVRRYGVEQFIRLYNKLKVNFRLSFSFRLIFYSPTCRTTLGGASSGATRWSTS